MSTIYVDGKAVAPPASTPSPQVSGETPAGDADSILAELRIKPYQEYLGDSDPKQLDYIIRTLNPDGKLEQEEVLQKIRDIDSKLGATPLGQTKLFKVYRYVKMVKGIPDFVLGGL